MAGSKNGSGAQATRAFSAGAVAAAKSIISGGSADLGGFEGADLELLEVVEELSAASPAGGWDSRLFDNTVVGVVEIDLDFNITYANQATLDLIGKNIEVFQTAFPKVDFDNLEGACVDVFHKDPIRIRRLLEQDRNLPHKAEITIGLMSFELNVTAMTDGDGNRIGTHLEWSDTTALRLVQGKLDAASLSQAIIEFTMDGTIQTANDNFLQAMGYTLNEIQGQHHRIFAPPGFAGSPEYTEFWAKLNRGEFVADEFLRIGKGGKEVWIQASYNPILDANGRPVRVVKFATDITPRKMTELQQQRATDAIRGLVASARERDLTARADVSEIEGQFRDLVQGVNEIVEIMVDALSRVESVTSEVSSAASEISQGSEKVAEGASTQASSIEEISASLEEMSSMTSQNADNALQAKGLASSAKESADRGDEQMGLMKSAIDAIKASSDETAKIVKTIDEISFQTNMLALNAAVEAARAGDAGRGFAVVAEEVRSLAQRSAEAAKTTAELIEGSAKNVDNGVQITEGVQAILKEITEGSNNVTDLITEIAAASKEQATGINQVNTAVDEMNRVTQENAANSEESSAAASELSSQVQRLMQLLSEFRINADGGSAPAASAPSPARAAVPAARAAKPSGGGGNSRAIPLDDDDLADF